MDLMTAITGRRSIRRFKTTPIPDGILKIALDAARFAPNAIGYQPWRFIVVRDESTRHRLSDIGNGQYKLMYGHLTVKEAEQLLAAMPEPYRSAKAAEDLIQGRWYEQMKLAPVLIAVCGYTEAHPFYLQDIACASLILMLTLYSHGIGTCWTVGASTLQWGDQPGAKGSTVKGYTEAQQEVRRLLSLPKGYEVSHVLYAGYPDETIDRKYIEERKGLDKILFFNRFGETTSQ